MRLFGILFKKSWVRGALGGLLLNGTLFAQTSPTLLLAPPHELQGPDSKPNSAQETPAPVQEIPAPVEEKGPSAVETPETVQEIPPPVVEILPPAQPISGTIPPKERSVW